MTATPPDCALSPWTNPDNGKVYECNNGIWTEKPSPGGGGGGGGETLDTVTTNGNETDNDIKVGTKVQLGNRHSLEVVENRGISLAQAGEAKGIDGMLDAYTWRKITLDKCVTQPYQGLLCIQAGTMYLYGGGLTHQLCSRNYLQEYGYANRLYNFSAGATFSNHYQDYWATNDNPISYTNGEKIITNPKWCSKVTADSGGGQFRDVTANCVWAWKGYRGNEGYFTTKASVLKFVSYLSPTEISVEDLAIAMDTAKFTNGRFATDEHKTYVLATDSTLHHCNVGDAFARLMTLDDFKSVASRQEGMHQDYVYQLEGVGILNNKAIVVSFSGYVCVAESDDPGRDGWTWYPTPFSTSGNSYGFKVTGACQGIGSNSDEYYVTAVGAGHNSSALSSRVTYKTKDGINWELVSEECAKTLSGDEAIGRVMPFTDYTGHRRYFAVIGSSHANPTVSKIMVTTEYFNEDGTIAGTGFPGVTDPIGGGGDGGGTGGGGSTGVASSLLYDGKRVLVEADARAMTSRIEELEDKLARLTPVEEPEVTEE